METERNIGVALAAEKCSVDEYVVDEVKDVLSSYGLKLNMKSYEIDLWKQDSRLIKDMKAMPVGMLEFKTRTANTLRKLGLETVGQMIDYRNHTMHYRDVLNQRLAMLGLSLDFTGKDWYTWARLNRGKTAAQIVSETSMFESERG